MGVLANVPFLGGYNEQDQINRAQEQQGLGSLSTMMTLQKHMQDMQNAPEDRALNMRLINAKIAENESMAAKQNADANKRQQASSIIETLSALPQDHPDRPALIQKARMLLDPTQALDPEKMAPSPFGKINPSEFTPQSIQKFSTTKNYGDLVPQAKPSNHVNVIPAPHITTDNSGNMISIDRTGVAKPVMMNGNPVIGKQANNPAAESIYKDYANHPQVKEANDLEVKLNPIVDYMTDVVKTGKSVNANDAALAKLYIATTTPVGSRAYSMDQKALARLPDLGDRIGNVASSFFAGHDLTDQTRKEMFNYIKNHYQELDAARQSAKQMALKRGAARGVSAEQLFGASE